MNNLQQYTYEYLLNLALSEVPDTVDKRQGSIIYDAIAPACYSLAFAFQEMYNLYQQTYADTSSGSELTRRCSERGVDRILATYAKRLAQFDIDVPIGARFSIENVTYAVTENLAAYQSYLVCEIAGNVGNIYFGDLTPVTSGVSVAVAELQTVVIAGEDEETDAQLRTRYYENLQAKPFGGNQSDYKEKTKALDNIGGCKVYPAWNGGGTVKLVIIDSSFDVPSAGIVTDTQTAIDPVANAGEGIGIAPIGHVVTVAAVTGVTTNIEMTLTFQSGFLWADVETPLRNAIEAYYLDLKETWDATTATTLVVRISQLESVALGVDGVIDVSGTTINSVAGNLALTEVQIPILGTVVNV